MKIKTSELIGKALDWGVSSIEFMGEYRPIDIPSYSTDWNQGGPIIEREGISIVTLVYPWDNSRVWEATKFTTDSENIERDTSLLIAAMRCYVASKLGEEVDIPEELIK